ncbi:hypothetical protein, partial [Pseudonocardia abyssalis]|uniref:hypothetical protein n=1 Tax=Pseudonocardia abyssalis TaxID=2792008 RepID=UPI001C49F0E1
MIAPSQRRGRLRPRPAGRRRQHPLLHRDSHLTGQDREPVHDQPHPGGVQPTGLQQVPGPPEQPSSRTGCADRASPGPGDEVSAGATS